MKAVVLIIILSITAWATHAQQKIVKYYANGKVKFEGFVKNKVLDSTYIEYYENGNKKREGIFKKQLYKTSSMSIIVAGCGVGKDSIEASDGIRNGVWKTYYNSGKISSTSNYFGDVLVGQSLSFDTTGRIDQNEFYNAGQLIQRQDYNDGILESFLTRTYKEAKNKSLKPLHTDLVHEYYETGELKCVKQLNNNNDLESIYTEYWPNGFVKLIGEYNADKKNGTFREYYENGNFKFEGLFTNDFPQGKQYYCNKQGKVIKIETWKNDKLIATELKAGL